MPEYEYEVVPFDGGFIPTALRHSDELCLVVKGGVILDLKEGDLPDRALLEHYDICVSREGVFTDNLEHRHIYQLVGSSINAGTVDLSVFVINPARWSQAPATDRGVLAKAKRMRMPRYMNHKCDRIIAQALSAKTAMDYGMLGEQASVMNYLPVYELGEANGKEMFAYRLEIALGFLDGLPDEARELVEAVASKTLQRAAKLRKRLAEINSTGVSA